MPMTLSAGTSHFSARVFRAWVIESYKARFLASSTISARSPPSFWNCISVIGKARNKFSSSLKDCRKIFSSLSLTSAGDCRSRLCTNDLLPQYLAVLDLVLHALLLEAFRRFVDKHQGGIE